MKTPKPSLIVENPSLNKLVEIAVNLCDPEEEKTKQEICVIANCLLSTVTKMHNRLDYYGGSVEDACLHNDACDQFGVKEKI